MPVDRVYHGTNWFVDPESFMLYRMVGEEIGGQTMSLADLTQGQLTASGGAIRDATTGRIVQPLMVEYPAQLNVMPTGQLLFQRETSAAAVNSPTRSASRYGASGEAETVLPNGELLTFKVQPWMTGQGQQVLIREDATPGTPGRFVHARLFDEAGNAIEPQVPPGFRFATGEEAINRAAVAELLRTQTDALYRMVNAGMVDDKGDPITNIYDAAGYISAHIDVVPSITSVLAA